MNSLTYDNRYKDRDPKETVKIIKNFFEDSGFICYDHFKNEFIESKLLYSGLVEIYYKGTLILRAGGKGTTLDFAMASGYAELYERFCNKINIFSDINLTQKMLDYNIEHFDYYIAPDERISLNYEQVITDAEKLQWYDYSASIRAYATNNFNKFILGSKYIELPYYSLFKQENEPIYLSPIMTVRAIGSTGMAAGNTLEEASVQGISEIFERYCLRQTIYNPTDIYYQVNNNSLKSETVINLIKDIESQGNKVQIFDLSYNFKLPAVLVIIRNEYTKNYIINFGSHPIFDIAVERSISELYQKYTSFREATFISCADILKPNDILYTCRAIESAKTLVNILPEAFFVNNKIAKLNTEVFLESQEYSNQDLFNHIKNISNSLNLRFYYYNFGPNKNIKALYIICPELTYIENNQIKDINELSKVINFDINRFKNILKNNLFKEEYQNISIALSPFISFYTIFHWDAEIQFNDVLAALNYSDKVINLPLLKELYKGITLLPYANKLADITHIFRFRAINKYSKEDAQKYARVLNINFSDELWEGCINPKFIINYIIKIRDQEYNDECINSLFSIPLVK